MIKITRLLEFDAAHRVMDHHSKCANLHGHRYKVEIVAAAPVLDHIGMVIDFSILKSKIGTWIDQNWDHTAIIFSQDVQTLVALEGVPKNKPIFVSSFNPTAENMAAYLLKEVCPQLMSDTGVEIVGVRVWETPNCYAEAGQC